jgi:phosphate:Na+ symporter
MIRKILLPTIFMILAYGFWVSPDFKIIAAGVAIFMFGMLSLEEGFKAFTGGLLENLLRRTTDRLWKSLSFGVISTAVMQSSSLVSVITISFLSAGLIPLIAGIGIVFGANLGTTTGAWLMAGFGLKVNIASFAMPMVVFGVILIFQKSKELKGFGYVLAGLGFLFLGIHYMKEGFEAFKGGIDLTAYAVSGYAGVVLFTLIGVVATVIMQSSHATLVLIITALAAQQVTYENALALAIGANLGTTITAMLGSIGSNVDGRRLAIAHLIFNLATATVAIVLIFQLTDSVDHISHWLGIAEDDYTLKLAVFHTVFNTLGVILMLPLITPLVNFLQTAISPKVRTAAQPRYLNVSTISLADTAIEAVRKETLHLYNNAFDIIAGGLRLHAEDIRSERPLQEVIDASGRIAPIAIDELYNLNVKSLYSEIIAYISRAHSNMTPAQTDDLFALRAAGKDVVEAIKDTKHLQKNLDLYRRSANPAIAAEYNTIRLELASVLRALDNVRERGDDSAAILSLDGLKMEMKENDRRLLARLDELVRKNRISAQMAISLINDSNYAYGVTKNLVKMGEILFSAGHIGIRSAERSLSLDADEVEKLLTETQTNIEERR